MADILPPDILPTPFHAGELAIQRELGVAERMDAFARKVVRDHMPDQHRAFFAQLPFLVAASVDRQGYPAITLLAGNPGFAHSPDARLLRIERMPDPSDPVREGWRPGEPVGLLGIELHTRRRNRLNGTLVRDDDGRFGVAVGQSFGNCPQYIHARTMAFAGDPAQAWHGEIESGQALDASARRTILGADTFFVGSHVDHGERGVRSVDASHRGGKPGFVMVRGNRLSIPDFAGNHHFNTLGNFVLNPRAGLVFVDFASGDMLHLCGDVVLDFDADEARAFEGAERLWHLDVRRWIRRRGAFPLRGDPGEASPNSLMTGSWEQSDARRKADTMRGPGGTSGSPGSTRSPRPSSRSGSSLSTARGHGCTSPASTCRCGSKCRDARASPSVPTRSRWRHRTGVTGSASGSRAWRPRTCTGNGASATSSRRARRPAGSCSRRASRGHSPWFPPESASLR